MCEFNSEREAEARTTERCQMPPYPVCSCKHDVASCRYVCMYVCMLGPLADLSVRVRTSQPRGPRSTRSFLKPPPDALFRVAGIGL